MSIAKKTFLIEGLLAFGAGAAWIAWMGINVVTGGALDDSNAEHANLARAGQLLMVAQNLLLVPAALVLHDWYAKRNRSAALQITACGIISLAFWSYASASRTNNYTVEATYLLLSGVWWLGLGWMLKNERQKFGIFTLVLGAIAFWDGILSAIGEVPFWLVATAAPKLILAVIWNFWLANVLLKAEDKQIESKNENFALHQKIWSSITKNQN
jgi:hypothetical protein